jgi:hypothetical protein
MRPSFAFAALAACALLVPAHTQAAGTGCDRADLTGNWIYTYNLEANTALFCEMSVSSKGKLINGLCQSHGRIPILLSGKLEVNKACSVSGRLSLGLAEPINYKPFARLSGDTMIITGVLLVGEWNGLIPPFFPVTFTRRPEIPSD